MKRIGILTYFRSVNNGAFLQAYSLWKFLSEMFADWAVFEIINYDSNKANAYYKSLCAYPKGRERYYSFASCREVLPLSNGELVSDDINAVADYIRSLNYDAVIAGSDEIWKTDGMRDFPNAYWLNFNIGNARKFAYAISGRNDFSVLNDAEKEYIREAIAGFDYIGIRDTVTRRELESISEGKYYDNCDPTFLMADYYHVDEEKIPEIRISRKIASKRKIVILMLESRNLYRQLYRMLSGEYMVISIYGSQADETDVDVFSQTPFQWQELISIADVIITSFFHGTVFSLIHDRKFVAIEYLSNGRGKIEDILNRYGLQNCLIYADRYNSEIALGMDLFTRARNILDDNSIVSYSDVITSERNRCGSFLRALEDVLKVEEADS